MRSFADLPPEEQRAYDLITAQDGLLQSELWKKLDTTSRTGSRLATSLEEKGLIEREPTTTNGHRTYLLKPTARPLDTNGHETPASGGDSSAEPATAALSGREERALSLIRERGGLYQSALWKELDVSSRTGSRIATTLEEEGLIRREETMHKGRQTYLLRPPKRDLDFSLLMAGDMISPLIEGSEEVDPIDSNEFTQWIVELAQDPQ